MTPENFDYLLEKVYSRILKSDTQMRLAVPPKLKTRNKFRRFLNFFTTSFGPKPRMLSLSETHFTAVARMSQFLFLFKSNKLGSS